MKKSLKNFALFCCVTSLFFGGAAFAQDSDPLTYENYPTVRLRSLDKITARTMTFDAQVGSIIKFGEIYIKIQACRKPPPVEKTESAAFLQIWEVDKKKNESDWIFSGWMFASSPALSGMDHPVYDVWVIDCLGKDPDQAPPPVEASSEKPLPDEGEVKDGSVKEPETAPEATLETTPDPVPAPQQQEEDQTQTPQDQRGDLPVAPDENGNESEPAPPEQSAPPSSDSSPKLTPEKFEGIY